MKARLSKLAGVAFATAAIVAPGAGAYVATGDGGSSAAQVMLGEGNSSSGQVVLGDGSSSSAQRVDEGSGGSSAAIAVRDEQNDFAWYSFVVAMSLLAALGATGAALTHRRSHKPHATLSI